jgi:phage replication O-like protein O
MASPQCENGYTKIANEIMEHLITQRVPGEQLRVLLCIIRASYGWNEKSVSITHQEIADQTRMARQSVTRAIKGLATKKLLRCDKDNNCLIFNKDYEKWENRPRRDTCSKKVAELSNKKVANKDVSPINIKKEKEMEKHKSKKYVPPTGSDIKINEPWINENAWDEWIKYRCEIKKPYKTEMGVNKALNVLRDLDEETQQQVIDLSISSEYQGIFPPKYKNKKNESSCPEPHEITLDNCDELSR